MVAGNGEGFTATWRQLLESRGFLVHSVLAIQPLSFWRMLVARADKMARGKRSN